MRILVSIATILAVLQSVARGQVMEGELPQPSEKEIVGLVGAPLSQVFAKMGFPNNVAVTGAKTKTPGVRLDYGTFAFVVREKQLRSCEFYNNWVGTAMGIKLWETTDEIEKKLGKPKTFITNPNGSGIMEWDIDQVQELRVVFNKDKKCIEVDVSKK